MFSSTLSTYMNLVRGIAAMAVVLYHIRDNGLSPVWLRPWLPPNGQAYAMIFFVISGFVIAHLADRKTASEFVTDRAVRIFSVALPTLVICALLSVLLPGASTKYPEALAHPFASFALCAVFLNESVALDIHPFLDGPYWSLSFEVFYYLIFGLWIYADRFKLPLTALACAAAGPKILLLFPCWLAGVAVHRATRISNDNALLTWTAVIVVPLLLLALLGISKQSLNVVSRDLVGYVEHSGEFLRNWLVAAAFAVHLWGVSRLHARIPAFLADAANRFAGMSFSLYLLHLPILLAVFALLRDQQQADQPGIGVVLIALSAAVAGSFMFSQVTEQRRHVVLAFVRRQLVRVRATYAAVPSGS